MTGKGPPEEAIHELSRSRKVPEQLRRYWKGEWKKLRGELDEVDYHRRFCEYLHNGYRYKRDILIVPEIRKFTSKNDEIPLGMDIMVIDSRNNVFAYEVKKGRGTNYQGFYNGIGEAVRNLERSNFSYLIYLNKDITNKEARRLRMLVKRHTNIGLKIARDLTAVKPHFLAEHDMDKNKVEGLRALARKIKRNTSDIVWHYQQLCGGCFYAPRCRTVRELLEPAT